MWFLAQDTGTTFGDFAGQIQGLLVATGIAGMIWFGLMILIFQRASERRRRKAEGLEPLPAIYVQGYRWLRDQFQGNTPPHTPDADIPMPPIDDLYAPIPDLDSLISDIPPAFTPQPDDVVVEGEIEPPPAPSAQPARVSTPSISIAALPDDAAEVMRVWRDINDGKLIVEIKGHYFSTAAEIESKGLSARFYSTVQEINALANMVNTPATPSKSDPETPPTPPKPNTIIEQIENFLQRKLTVTPELAANTLHIRAAPHGGLMIQVNNQFYDGVDEIEDEAIRGFIQQTIQEWERQH